MIYCAVVFLSFALGLAVTVMVEVPTNTLGKFLQDWALKPPRKASYAALPTGDSAAGTAAGENDRAEKEPVGLELESGVELSSIHSSGDSTHLYQGHHAAQKK